jgi:predicted metal-binding protein
MGEVTVTVCTTCRKTVDGERVPAEPRPGLRLHDALQAADLPEGVRLRGNECLSACSNGCSLALTGGPDRWTYIYGRLDPDDHLDQILAGIRAYAATADGLVPWRERPEVFRKQSIARIPPLTAPDTKD